MGHSPGATSSGVTKSYTFGLKKEDLTTHCGKARRLRRRPATTSEDEARSKGAVVMTGSGGRLSIVVTIDRSDHNDYVID